jgi:DNA-binding NarL/FixJ family response regulator
MPRRVLFAFLAAALIGGLVTLDHVRSPEPFDPVAFMTDLLEMALLVGAVTMAAFAALETRVMRIERVELLDDLATARRESARWRETARAHVAGLSQAIAAQFRVWSLTEAEADVAGLMLKGLAHKEIAALRDCSEATVRQHATAVYRKSGLTSRSQLTAYFLEDLLMPSAEPPSGDLRVVHRRT